MRLYCALSYEGNSYPKRRQLAYKPQSAFYSVPVRGVQIAENLGRTRATVSIMLKALEKDGFVTMHSDRSVSLTDKGAEIAVEMAE
mgnify:CR=1 FL=1